MLRMAPTAAARAFRSAPKAAAAAKAPALAFGLGLSGAAVATTTNCEGDYLRRNFVADAAAKALPAVVNLTSDVQKGWCDLGVPR
jgi:hypothetical protein